MIGDKSLSQSGGEAATNISAGGDVIYSSGLDYSEVVDIIETKIGSAITPLKYDLSEVSREVQSLRDERASRLGKAYLDEVQSRGELPPVARMYDPDVARTLEAGFSGYVRMDASDAETGALARLIADRVYENNRSTLAVALNLAVETLPKVTEAQLFGLSLAWRIRSTFVWKDINQSLGEAMASAYSPFLERAPKADAPYRFLAAVGCCEIEEAVEFIPVVKAIYPAWCTDGLPRAEVPQALIDLGLVRDSWRVEGNCVPTFVRGEVLDALSLPDDLKREALALLDVKLFASDEALRDDLFASSPDFFGQLEDRWNNTLLRAIDPTTVGVVIAHAFAGSLTGFRPGIGEWVAD